MIISYILIITDLIFTRYWVHKYGLDIEGNPIGKWILSALWRQIVFKLFAPGVLLAIIYALRTYRIAVWGSWIILIAYSALVIYHLVLLIITKRITKLKSAERKN